ncbi:MAG: hypothetical protein GVY18_03565 [Bacteroidetes bacterium]|nr:hypothetical protein [Bacteroidota bacterium]
MSQSPDPDVPIGLTPPRWLDELWERKQRPRKPGPPAPVMPRLPNKTKARRR